MATFSHSSRQPLRAEILILLPGIWVDGQRFDEALTGAGGAHESPEDSTIRFLVAPGCKLKIDATLRLLSLANQLANRGRLVCIEFGDTTGAMGYLDRMGFFDHLDAGVRVLPERPAGSAAQRYRGNNGSLVEIAAIARRSRDATLPGRLTSALQAACEQRPDATALGNAAWLLFAELVANVYDHSETPLDGYAALQLYPGGKNVQVAVADSGLGIITTLRPALARESPYLAGLSDLDLVVEMFQKGVSRYGRSRGSGLAGCAAKAIRFDATLDVRLPRQHLTLEPHSGSYAVARAVGRVDLAEVWGTQVCFNFRLP